MTQEVIEERLKEALLHDGPMEIALYELELELQLDDFRQSMEEDNDDYFFAITENKGHVAMVLIDGTGTVSINEKAREKLKEYWPAAYESNLKRLIPEFARELSRGMIPITGIKIKG